MQQSITKQPIRAALSRARVCARKTKNTYHVFSCTFLDFHDASKDGMIFMVDLVQVDEFVL